MGAAARGLAAGRRQCHSGPGSPTHWSCTAASELVPGTERTTGTVWVHGVDHPAADVESPVPEAGSRPRRRRLRRLVPLVGHPRRPPTGLFASLGGRKAPGRHHGGRDDGGTVSDSRDASAIRQWAQDGARRLGPRFQVRPGMATARTTAWFHLEHLAERRGMERRRARLRILGNRSPVPMRNRPAIPTHPNPLCRSGATGSGSWLRGRAGKDGRRGFRAESPFSSRRQGLCARRSGMASANVGPPMTSCHFSTGSPAVEMVELTPWRSSRTSSRRAGARR